MKAIRIDAYGGPELMQLDDAPVPTCGAGDLLVRVIAAGVNPIDWKLRSGVMAAQIPKSFPITLGFDAVGIVTAVGGGVSGFELGDEVYFYAEFVRGGTYAEYVAVDASQVAKKPRTASFAAAAALPMAGQAAWTALIETGQVERGMRMLIHGGVGALGTTAVQLAKKHGAHVTATASGDDLALIRSRATSTSCSTRWAGRRRKRPGPRCARAGSSSRPSCRRRPNALTPRPQRVCARPLSSHRRVARCWRNWPSVSMTGACASSSARSLRWPTRPRRTAWAKAARREAR